MSNGVNNEEKPWYHYKVVWVIVACIFIGYMLSESTKQRVKNTLLEVPPMPDSVFRAQKIQDSIQTAIDAKKAMEAQEAEDRKFYTSKAGKIHKRHPEWSREACKRLANGEIWIGMSLDMLKYERGLPDAANPSDYGNGVQWQWCWNDWTPSCFYDKDNDGFIDSYN